MGDGYKVGEPHIDGPKKYQLIYADPSWTYNDKGNAGKRGASHKYSITPFDEMCAMPINSIADENCLLAMWWTGPLFEEALQLVKEWGFKTRNMTGFTWHKKTKHGKDVFGMGHYTRGNAENCLFAVKGNPKRVDASVRQLIEAPVREHSRKPDEARDRLVQLMGDVPRIELFARQRFEGWDASGHELENSIKLVAA